MYSNILIKNLDNFGRGISYINNKIVFIKNALPGEIVDIKITTSKKKYQEAIVTKYHQKSPQRILTKCPYFNKCGGCNLLFFNYLDTLTFKLNKVKDLFTKNNINYSKEIEVIKNTHPLNYRHKLSLKIKNKQIGFYEENTHNLIPINECLLATSPINEVIKNYKLLNISNGDLTIRASSNNEILLVINTPDNNYNIELSKLKSKVKLVGIVYNNKTIYGQNFYYERLRGFLFKISYDSFFQVNPYITEELFKLLKSNIKKDSTILELYSGVGTLSLVCASQSKTIYSVEIIKNAILNSNFNAKINHISNIKFMLGDVKNTVSKLNIFFDTLILDPPRKGLDKTTLNFILTKLPPTIIYISCDILTLIRDLKYLEKYYDLQEYKILDMFSYTYHLESFCVLNLR